MATTTGWVLQDTLWKRSGSAEASTSSSKKAILEAVEGHVSDLAKTYLNMNPPE